MAETTCCVALTGGTGFVGRHVLAHLLSAGHRVRALVRDPARLRGADANLVAVEGDLFDDNALAELINGADAVIHLVGIIMENPQKGQTFERVHVEGTTRLIAAAKAAGSVRKWVQMSALGTRPDAASVYHRTKWQAEQAVRASGFDYTIIRPSIIHGPDGEFMQMVRNWWCDFLPPFIVPYFGKGLLGLGGAGKLQPVWVEDVAKCFVDALTNPRASNETYPLGGPEAMTWPQLLRTVRKHLPNARRKRVLAIPVWKAKFLATMPKAPFNRDQVVMSQEDSTCSNAKVHNDFGVDPAPFEATLADYASQL